MPGLTRDRVANVHVPRSTGQHLWGIIFGAVRHMRILLLLSMAALASGAQRFPTITGETVDGRTITLPDPASKDFTLVVMALGKGAQKDLEAWYEPAYLRFVAKHGLMAGAYECDLWFVPVFVGLNKAAYDPTMNRLRKSAEPEVAQRVLFFKGEFDAIQQALGLKRADVPYFFVLDGQGNIVHRTEGAFSEEKLEAIEEVMMR